MQYTSEIETVYFNSRFEIISVSNRKLLCNILCQKCTYSRSNEEIKHIALSLLYELKWYWTWYFDPVATEATVSIQGNSWCCLVSMFQCWFKVTERATNTWKYKFKYPSSDWGLLWIMLHHKHITHPMVT